MCFFFVYLIADRIFDSKYQEQGLIAWAATQQDKKPLLITKPEAYKIVVIVSQT